MTEFDYSTAFSRNIGWVTHKEQQALKNKRVAVGGLGGVGGSHLVTLARMGVGNFNISDLDEFELANMNRQHGAGMSTLGRAKANTMESVIHDINPGADIRVFENGITPENLDDFLAGCDLYMDSLDIFALDIRRRVFQACYDLGIPTITAAPMGMGTAFLIFLPGKMSFEQYFCLDGYDFEDQIIKFVIGVSPTVQQRHYLVDRSAVNFLKKKVPSTAMGIEIAAGVACSNAIKLLLGRGPIIHAPWGLHFDAYRNRMIKTWRPFGNNGPTQKLMFWYVKRLLAEEERKTLGAKTTG